MGTTNVLDGATRYYRRYAAEFPSSGHGRNDGAAAHVARREQGGAGADARAVQSCHDARREQLMKLADQLLDCYILGRNSQAAKDRLVTFVTSEIIVQIAAEDDAFRPIAEAAGSVGLIDAMPAAPDHIRRLVGEIAENQSEVAIAAAAGSLVLLMDARAALESAVLLPALTRSPSGGTTLTALLGCCGAADPDESRSEWWIG